MVKFNKIYICIGDDGMIGFVGGDCVFKIDLCVEVYGVVDEINFFIGMVCFLMGFMFVFDLIFVVIQNVFFDFGVDFVLFGMLEELGYELLWVIQKQVDDFEYVIDVLNVNFQLLKFFVLFGGLFVLVVFYVVCMVVCCVECLMVVLNDCEYGGINLVVMCYINCLLDLFFVVVCVVNDNGVSDVFWVLGKDRQWMFLLIYDQNGF